MVPGPNVTLLEVACPNRACGEGNQHVSGFTDDSSNPLRNRLDNKNTHTHTQIKLSPKRVTFMEWLLRENSQGTIILHMCYNSNT